MVSELIQEDYTSKWIAHSNHNVKCFREDEIKRITNNYGTLLGRGSFGEVYEGVLEDRSMVAVKKFVRNIREDFVKELTVHREINHRNVVRLIGYCADENALMMVTEYISKGNLNDALHHDNIPIPLDTRLRIAIECAEALVYMHSHMYTQVIHGDIKPANILLDDQLRAKISDFGISRLVNTDNTLYTLNVIGSIGYMDPLFTQHGRLTSKSDVYSFGVVLFELITRKKARTDDGKIIVGSFTEALAKGIKRVRVMFDTEIATPGNMKTIEQVAKLAGKCLSLQLDNRPEMLDVVECLRRFSKAAHQGQERLPLFSWGRKNKPAPAKTSATDSHQVAGPSQESSRNGQNLILFSFGPSGTALQVELDDMLRASAEVLGKGTVGTTYKAILESGAELVVKRMKGVDLPQAKFAQCITAIGAIENEHIVPLRGYYYSKDEKLLLYDSMPMGSLSEMLHGDRVSGRAPLDWGQRSAISIAVARGIAFIHSCGPSSNHGNIKSSNVLLSHTHDACVSEHGLLTLIDPCSNVSAYRAPEVTGNIMSVSQKADVYSFGILLLELLTGKTPGNREEFEEEVDLLTWVYTVVREECTEAVLDVDLRREQHNGGKEEGSMVQLLRLAIDCCNGNADLRLAMSDVVQRIEMIRLS